MNFAASLLNYQQRGDSLLHSLRACEAKAIVVGEELLEAIEEIRPQIEGVTIFVIGERGVPRCGLLPPQSLSLDNILHQMPTHPPEVALGPNGNSLESDVLVRFRFQKLTVSIGFSISTLVAPRAFQKRPLLRMPGFFIWHMDFELC